MNSLMYKLEHHFAGVCLLRVFGGLGGVALAPNDLARRVLLTAVTGEAMASSVLATAC